MTIETRKLGELDALVLGSGDAQMTLVPARGALVTSLFARGREWLFLDETTLHDPAHNVRGGVPVLFPSPGKLEGDRYARDGRAGAMKQHGFARNGRFREIARDDGAAPSVTLALEDDATTLAMFPWPFRLTLRFTLVDLGLAIDATVENNGAAPLPFGLGYHPYFAVPQAAKAVCKIPTRATRVWDNVVKRERDLGSLDLTLPEVDLHLVDHGAREASLDTPDGRVDLAGPFDRWVIWTLAGRDFVCLEPWTAPGNALNTGAGILTLAPGETRSFALRITTHR